MKFKTLEEVEFWISGKGLVLHAKSSRYIYYSIWVDPQLPFLHKTQISPYFTGKQKFLQWINQEVNQVRLVDIAVKVETLKVTYTAVREQVENSKKET